MNRHDLQKLAEAYTNVHEKKDSSYLETDMKKRQENNEKARKDMAKVKGQKNPHFESVEVEEEKKELPKSKMFRKAGNLGREVVSPSTTDDQRQKAYDRSKKIVKTLNKENQKEEVSSLAAAYNAVYEVEETETVDEAMSSYDRNRKRAAQRAADRNAARAAGKTGVVPGVGYVTPRMEKETYTDEKGTVRHKSGAKNEEYEVEMEGYKGKHGQSDKEYADSRSSGGKMVSGDSKMSGAEYTHGRRVKAGNPGMQPDVGGKTKPKSQGKMDKGTRADMQYRKANLKKEELEATGKFTAEEIDAIINVDIEEGKGKAAAGGFVGNIAGKLGGLAVGSKLGGSVGANIGSKVGGVAGGAAGAALGAKKGRKGSAALGGGVGALGGAVGSAAGGAIASSHEMEGNPIFEATKGDIEQYAVNEIAGALANLAGKAKSVAGAVKSAGSSAIDTAKSVGSSAIDTAKSVGSSAIDTAKSVGSSIKDTVTGSGQAAAKTSADAATSGGGLGDKIVQGGKKALDFAKKNPGKTAAIAGAGAVGGIAAKKMMDD